MKRFFDFLFDTLYPRLYELGYKRLDENNKSLDRVLGKDILINNNISIILKYNFHHVDYPDLNTISVEIKNTNIIDLQSKDDLVLYSKSLKYFEVSNAEEVLLSNIIKYLKQV